MLTCIYWFLFGITFTIPWFIMSRTLQKHLTSQLDYLIKKTIFSFILHRRGQSCGHATCLWWWNEEFKDRRQWHNAVWFQLLSWLSAYLFDMWSSLFSAIWGNTKIGQCRNIKIGQCSKNFSDDDPCDYFIRFAEVIFCWNTWYTTCTWMVYFLLNRISLLARWPSKALFFNPLSPLRASSTESSTDSFTAMTQ